jgi:hypothetical protein
LVCEAMSCCTSLRRPASFSAPSNS